MGGGRDVSELKRIAEDVVKNRIERITGVASVMISGGQERQVHVNLDPTLMRSYGIPFEYVIQSLQAANLNLPGGQIDTGRQEVTIRTTGEFQTLADIGEVRVPTATGSVLLRDIATIAMGESDVREFTRLNQQPSVVLQVVKESGANTVQVARSVREELDRIASEIDDLEFVIVYDESDFVEASINSVEEQRHRRWTLGCSGPLYLLAQPPVDLGHRSRDPDLDRVHVCPDLLQRDDPEHDLPGRSCFRRRHAGRQLDRRPREYLPPPVYRAKMP